MFMVNKPSGQFFFFPKMLHSGGHNDSLLPPQAERGITGKEEDLAMFQYTFFF